MDLSIVIINFNTPDITRNCLSSIIRHTSSLEFEILLLDNNPSDDYERDFKCLVPGLRYVKIDENLGFGRANNLGMQMATGKYILLLNSDTLLLNNAFYDCISFLESEAGRLTDVMGIKLLNEDGTYQQSFYPYLTYNYIHYCKSNNPIQYKIFIVGKDNR